LYGLKHARKLVQDVLFFHGEPNFTRSEYNHFVYGIFIILALNVILVASTSMFEINRLAELVRTFDMKDLRASKQILDMEIHRDRKYGKFGSHNKTMW